MNDEMIERCAKAYSGVDLNSWHPNVQEQIKGTIVDIIKAMREPTEKMIEAAYGSNTIEEGSSAYGCWQAMIDSITND